MLIDDVRLADLGAELLCAEADCPTCSRIQELLDDVAKHIVLRRALERLVWEHDGTLQAMQIDNLLSEAPDAAAKTDDRPTSTE